MTCGPCGQNAAKRAATAAAASTASAGNPGNLPYVVRQADGTKAYFETYLAARDFNRRNGSTGVVRLVG